MPNIDILKHYKRIHMIGIGGVSMSGIAELLLNWGFTVTGSDSVSSNSAQKLIDAGVKVTIGHFPQSVNKADIVVYTAAISPDNVELLRAKQLKIPTIERADFLGALTKCFQDTIAISGTHGKTTTTSMISLCFIEELLDPTIQVGANVKQLNGNYRVGNSEYFIIEACEYVESFLKFRPKTEIILNIDNDHLDYFKNFDNIKTAFKKYVELLPENGLLFLNADDVNCLELKNYTNAKSITYGVNNKTADYFALNITFDDNGFPEFDVYYDSKFYDRVKLNVPGTHNILNSLACIALCNEYHISKQTVVSALAKFSGANRRFEFKGKINNANIYDDYAHHPTEIIATSKALMNKKYNESWIIFQPHTYSRTKNHLDEFAKALLNFDHLSILDIYAAREKNIYNVSSQDLVNKINEYNNKAIYIPNFEECTNYLKQNVKENDIVITLGAGTITELSDILANM